MLLAYLLLGTALTISAVAIYYSVAGLAAIFAAAFWPIVIMGTTLEVAKLVAASWLKMYWEKVPKLLKWYLTASVVVLMLITSMGIFGFLSKAHLDQNLVSGDVQSKIAVYDEKIKTSKDNIDTNRRALAQMDAAVDQTMSRSTTEGGADKAVAIRRSQAKERTRLQNEIAAEQKTIATLNEQAAPIRAEVRKVEAEVGPIKYIAAFIYGDNPDANVLEKAVTWVIIMIIFVFDPLAVLMLLASQWTFVYLREQTKPVEAVITETPVEEVDVPETAETSHAYSPWPFPSTLWPFPKKEQEPAAVEGVTEPQAVVEYQILEDVDGEPDIPLAVEPIELNKEILAQADPYDSDVTYDWDGGSKIYSKSYIQHLIKQLQEKKISINNLNQEELNEITAELEIQQIVEPNKDNNTA